ncbi:MAG: cytochrome c biogenesis protein CcsA [Mariprofundaceae bacterium]|nr:cytochrome c biogenesis protein CcsA [Mariprofundaceae bacterium]
MNSFFIISGLITLACAFFVSEKVWKVTPVSEKVIGASMLLAIACTLFGIILLEPLSVEGVNFRLPAAVAICTVLVQSIYTWGLLHHGVRGLGLFLLPSTALPLLMIPFLPDAAVWVQTASALQIGHLLISLCSYAVLTLAALHALMHLLLDRALKRKMMGPMVQSMPSLMEIENHMFAQVKWSLWLLSLGLLSGLAWQWGNLGALELLSHKIVLAFLAWVMLLMMLVFRPRFAHTRRASMIVLGSYSLLLLSYFGVKLIQSWLS